MVETYLSEVLRIWKSMSSLCLNMVCLLTEAKLIFSRCDCVNVHRIRYIDGYGLSNLTYAESREEKLFHQSILSAMASCTQFF